MQKTIPNFASHTPTFLNMNGQVGIFRANGRLGFWDSANSVSWSSLFDHSDFEPSIETGAGNAIFSSVIGRITTIVPQAEGFIIYATKSIVGARFSFDVNVAWDTSSISSTAGVAYPFMVTTGLNELEHYAFTNAGIKRIGQYSSITKGHQVEDLVPDVYDILKESRLPIRLDILNGRYLYISQVSSDYIDGRALFKTITVDTLAFNVFGNTPITIPAVSSFPMLDYPNTESYGLSLYNRFASMSFAESLNRSPFNLILRQPLGYISSVRLEIPEFFVLPNEYIGTQSISSVVNGSNSDSYNHPRIAIGDYMSWLQSLDWSAVLEYPYLMSYPEATPMSFRSWPPGVANPKDLYRYLDSLLLSKDVSLGVYSIPPIDRPWDMEKYGSSNPITISGLGAFWLDSPAPVAATSIHWLLSDVFAYVDSLFPFSLGIADLLQSIQIAQHEAADVFPWTSTTLDEISAAGYVSTLTLYDQDPSYHYYFSLSYDYFVNFDERLELFRVYIKEQKQTLPIIEAENGYILRTRYTYTTIKVYRVPYITAESNGTYRKYFGIIYKTEPSNTYDFDVYINIHEIWPPYIWDFPLRPNSATVSVPATDLSVALSSYLRYPTDSTFTYPGATFLLQDGSVAPIYPEYTGAFVLDLALKKWGKVKASYTALIDYQPLNKADSIISYSNFGMEAGMLSSNGVASLFTSTPTDSWIKYGKVGFYRLGTTVIQEVKAHFRSESTGTIEIDTSLDGKAVEATLGLIHPFTSVVNTTAYSSQAGSWHTIKISGQYDLQFLEIRGTISGRR